MYEVERKFLVPDGLPSGAEDSRRIEQAYLWSVAGYAVRARHESAAGQPGSASGTLTLKGPKDERGKRLEVEVPIPPADAARMVEAAEHVVVKDRWQVLDDGRRLDVDVFHGALAGLVVAEYEADGVAVAAFDPPEWCGAEVTADHRYNNENLAQSQLVPVRTGE